MGTEIINGTEASIEDCVEWLIGNIHWGDQLFDRQALVHDHSHPRLVGL